MGWSGGLQIPCLIIIIIIILWIIITNLVTSEIWPKPIVVGTFLYSNNLCCTIFMAYFHWLEAQLFIKVLTSSQLPNWVDIHCFSSLEFGWLGTNYEWRLVFNNYQEGELEKAKKLTLPPQRISKNFKDFYFFLRWQLFCYFAHALKL